MPVKREPCKFFQRGNISTRIEWRHSALPVHAGQPNPIDAFVFPFSCQYGDRCKYLHVVQQQHKSNPFGFGSDQQHKSNLFGFGSDQQGKSNPYGFGVQNNSQTKGAADFGPKQSQNKPFENKWSRFSSATAAAAPSSQKSDKQAQTTNHTCTDPESCRSIIVGDFKHERPLWKLTCYGHWKNSPCDIAGDISYEELRAAAYDDANRGLNLQSIVERERSLLNTKLLEFENLCKPHTALPNSTLASQNPSPSASPNGFLQSAQNSVAPSVSSFTQLGTSLNTGFGPRQLNPFPNSSQTPSGVGTNNFPSGSVVGSQFPASTHGNGFPSNTGLINTGIIRPQTNPFATLAVSQIPSATTGQSPIVGQSTTEVEFVTNMQTEKISGNTSIWLKKIWSPGEIPEEDPPEALVEFRARDCRQRLPPLLFAAHTLSPPPSASSTSVKV
ncbi:hypothetical protein DVH24_000668 [Malus domestica]|uniref:C3H1-type domain-containing protein n=1 Tax=Malus domestica TaxID=3750 RepID=A0A498K2B1_MALDO|nr:hypothetical protein DVH24_000668 [Malus domestica]